MLTQIINNKLLINTLLFFLFMVAILIAVYIVKDDILTLKLPPSRHYYYLILVCIFQLLFWISSTFAWISGINIFTKTKIPFINGYIHCNTVSIGKYLPGKIWGLLGRGIELKKRNITNKEIIFISYIDQILLLHSGFVISSVFLSAYYFGIYSYICIALAGLTLPIIPMLNNRLFNLKYLNNFINSTINLKNYMYLFLLYCFLWVSAGLVFASIYFVLYDFKYELIYLLIGACAIGILSGFITFFSPGGIGVREFTSSAILSLFIPTEEALVLVLVYRIWTTFTDVFGGMISLYLMHFISRQVKLNDHN